MTGPAATALAALLLAALAGAAPAADAVRAIASFDDRNPFAGEAAAVVAEHATDGGHALRIAGGWAAMEEPQDWSGYDTLRFDLFSEAKAPFELTIEIRDAGTTDYYSRVNWQTAVEPGASAFVLPLKQLFVGEKARPGRPLDLARITRLVIGVPDGAGGALFVDRVRVERDDAIRAALFDGLRAFDLGTPTSPVMDGFTQVSPETIYDRGRGYGLLDAHVWRAFDVLQPEPLYQDFICIESGGFAVDVANGDYTVVLNLDNPSGYWGEYQTYQQRSVTAEGRVVVDDHVDFAAFQRRYFRSWDNEDSSQDDVFAKYQKTAYGEKRFDVQVADGRLDLGFSGENYACSVTSIIVWPKAKAREGEAFLAFVEQRRRFYFENAFRRVTAPARGDPLAPTAADTRRGFVWAPGDWMAPPRANDTFAAAAVGQPLTGEAFAGEYEPLLLSIAPLADLGEVSLSVGALAGPGGAIPADRIDVAYLSQRITRSNMQGSIFSVQPRLLLPRRRIEGRRGETRSFWLTVRTPAEARPGVYAGTVTVTAQRGGSATVPIRFRVRAGALDPADLPVGPWGHQIGLPWPGPEAAAWGERATVASLAKIREYGFTTCTGLPNCSLQGFQDGKPVIDFTAGDHEMRRLRAAGFTMPVVSYCPFGGLDTYHRDEARMRACGFSDYPSFIKAVFGAVQEHARQNDWLPVYWNIGDEPIGDDLVRATENAEAYRQAFPQGPPWFTAASSFFGSDAADPHFKLSRALHVADWNLHDEAGVRLLHDAGGDWAFYNGGSRWTFGTYMFKAAKQFGMRFRLSWIWNNVAGDPYYGLDCREDDYAWCNAAPDGTLIPSVDFEDRREGLDDYRRLLTLDRLAREQAGTPAAAAGRRLIDERMAAFKLGDRDNHDALFGHDDWRTFRARVDDAIEALR